METVSAHHHNCTGTTCERVQQYSVLKQLFVCCACSTSALPPLPHNPLTWLRSSCSSCSSCSSQKMGWIWRANMNAAFRCGRGTSYRYLRYRPSIIACHCSPSFKFFTVRLQLFSRVALRNFTREFKIFVLPPEVLHNLFKFFGLSGILLLRRDI
jgi:hypothetical protein